MRILILGITGMLGSAVFKILSDGVGHDVWGSLRNEAGKAYFPEATRPRLLSNLDVLDLRSVTSTLIKLRPEVVINCTGIVKQLEDANDPLRIMPLNALFPHHLAGLCALSGARLVGLSSDCVYSGRKGDYEEADPTDAEDLYGKSKSIGEVLDSPHAITLRTSGIGHEMNSCNGLLSWFLSQQGKVRGFANAIYSGLPSVELARAIRDYVLPHPELHGLYHVSAKPISKFDLLKLVAAQYGKSIEIERDESVRIDRSLNSSRFTRATGYVAPEWAELVSLMHRNR